MTQSPRLPLSAIVVASLLGVCLLFAAHLVNHVTVGSRLVDADLENNLPTWYASFHFSAAAVAALVVVGRSVGAQRLWWLALSALCLAFSVDETASLHEVAGRQLGAETTLSLTQPVAAAVVAGFLLLVARSTRGRPARALVAAAVVLVVSQTCASIAGLFTSGGALFLLEAVEDSTETLVAVLLLIAGLLGVGLPPQWRPRAVLGELIDWYRGSPGAVSAAASPAEDRVRSGRCHLASEEGIVGREAGADFTVIRAGP